MRKQVITVIAALLLIGSLAGCTVEIKNAPQTTVQSAKNTPKASAAASGSPVAKPSSTATSPASSGANTQNGSIPGLSQDQISQTMDNVMAEKKWPTGSIYSVPEWKGVTKIYSMGDSLDDHAGGDYALRVDATEKSLTRYLDDLKAAGYTVGSSDSPQSGKEYTASLGPVNMSIKDGGENSYDIVIELQKVGTWPAADLPSIITPISGKAIIGEPRLSKPGDGVSSGALVDESGYNFHFAYSGLTKEDAVQYMKYAASKLTNGSYSEGTYLDYGGGIGVIRGQYTWNGTNYYVYGEGQGNSDGSTFDFYFGWSPKEMGW